MGLDLRPPARYLPDRDRAAQAKGLPVSLTVEGERRHPHVGKAIFIDNKVDTQTSTFLVRAEVPNPDGTLLPGEYIRATMTIGEYVDAIVVPEQAVLEGQEGLACLRRRRRRTRSRSPRSSRSTTTSGLRVLESGLEAGQKVIVEGIQLVRPGQDVERGRGPARAVPCTTRPAVARPTRASTAGSRDSRARCRAIEHAARAQGG